VAGFCFFGLFGIWEYEMSTAVLVHELYKKFSTPGLQIWGRTSRLGLKASGHIGASYPALVVAAVDHVSFTVQEAEIFGVLGASDSGKTTLVRLLATLLQPDEGELYIFGRDAIRQPRQVQRLVNRVSVEASFFKKRSPVENLLYGARLYGFSGSEIRGQAEDILVRLGLGSDEIYQPLETLDRAAQQKVAIANALLARPRLLLLDEPTRGFDRQTQGEVLQVLRDLREAYGMTILITTEDMAQVEGLCDHIALLESGRLAALDTAEGLKQQLLFHGWQSIIQAAPELSGKTDQGA
jgi:ABC-2 type transport system ATP-binding protein